MDQNILPKYFEIWHNTKKLENFKKLWQKCIDQVYFVEQWSKRQGLKISKS